MSGRVPSSAAHIPVPAAFPCRRRSPIPPVVPGVELAVPARRRRASRLSHRMVVRDGLAAGRGGQRRSGSRSRSFACGPGIAEPNPSRFAPTQVLFGHAAIADPRYGRLRHAERSARAGFDLAYAREGAVDVRLDDWSMRQDGGRYRRGRDGRGFRAALDLDARRSRRCCRASAATVARGPSPRAGEPLLQPAAARGRGEMTIDGRARARDRRGMVRSRVVERLRGRRRAAAGTGLGINLDDGGALMAFRMRDARRAASAGPRRRCVRADGQRADAFGPDEVEWTPRPHVAFAAHGRRPTRARGELRVGERDVSSSSR